MTFVEQSMIYLPKFTLLFLVFGTYILIYLFFISQVWSNKYWSSQHNYVSVNFFTFLVCFALEMPRQCCSEHKCFVTVGIVHDLGLFIVTNRIQCELVAVDFKRRSFYSSRSVLQNLRPAMLAGLRVSQTRHVNIHQFFPLVTKWLGLSQHHKQKIHQYGHPKRNIVFTACFPYAWWGSLSVG